MQVSQHHIYISSVASIYIGQGEVAEGAAGGELRQEVEGVAKELQGAQLRQAAQVNHRGGQPVGLQRQLPQLGAALYLPCAAHAWLDLLLYHRQSSLYTAYR